MKCEGRIEAQRHKGTEAQRHKGEEGRKSTNDEWGMKIRKPQRRGDAEKRKTRGSMIYGWRSKPFLIHCW